MSGTTKRGLRRRNNWRGLNCIRIRDRSGLRREWASKLLNGINSRTKDRGRHQWLGHGSQVHANPRVHTAKPADTIGNSDYSFPSDPAFAYRNDPRQGNSKVSTFIGSRSREWSANLLLYEREDMAVVGVWGYGWSLASVGADGVRHSRGLANVLRGRRLRA